MEVGKGGGVGVERDFACNDGHTLQCTDGVLLSYTLKTCMVLQIDVTSINLTKK